MRRQLLSLACGLNRRPQPTASVLLTSHKPSIAHSYTLPTRQISTSTPLLGQPTPSKWTSQPTSTTPPTSPAADSSLPSIRKPQRLWTPDYVSPSKHIMDYLTAHGPQTRRTLYAIFGPTPQHSTPTSAASADTPTSGDSTVSTASTEAAEAIAASPVVQSHPSCLRSKSHLTTLLQQLTRTGRVLTKRATATTGTAGSRRSSALYVYEMRDYATSWNKVRFETEKGRKQRKKQARLVEKAAEEEQRVVTKERRRQRLEAGMTTRG